jgi:hypothetical protein
LIKTSIPFRSSSTHNEQRLAPDYATAAKELKNRDPPVPLAKVDATVESDIANRLFFTSRILE